VLLLHRCYEGAVKDSPAITQSAISMPSRHMPFMKALNKGSFI